MSISLNSMNPSTISCAVPTAYTVIVSDETIQAILLSQESLEKKTQDLIDSANAVGGYDNTTVVLMAI